MSIPFWFTLLLIILVQMAAETGAVHGKEPADTSSKLHRLSPSSADQNVEQNRQQDRQQPLQQNSGREGDEGGFLIITIYSIEKGCHLFA